MRLVAEEGGFAYISDTYDDELPYWLDHDGHGNAIPPQLIIPYTLDANDMRFATPQGFNTGDHFFAYLKDTFDTLYAEGKAGRPRMMNIGLHCRLVGRPGRAEGLRKFIDYVKGHKKVWLARRIDIAEHWRGKHPYQAPALRPSRMEKAEFVAAFGGIFEHSPWIAEGAFKLELGPAHDSAGGVHNALSRIFRSASEKRRLGVSDRAPRSRRQAGAGQAPDQGIDIGTGQRRPKRPDRRRAQEIHRIERRLCEEIRLSIHHCGTRQHQGIDPEGV